MANKHKNPSITFHLTKELKDRINKATAQSESTKTSLINYVVESWLDREGF